MARIVETLERCPLFAGLTREEFDPLVLACRLRTPMKDEPLFRAGEPAEAFFVVASGAFKLWNVVPGGKEVVVEVTRPGQSFALMPVIDGGMYPVHATAIANSAVVRIPGDAYRRLLARRPDLYQRAVKEMAEKMRCFRQRLEDQTVRSVPERVAGHIVRLAEREGLPLRPGTVVDLGGTREVIAQSLGTVREVFARALGGMEKEGVVALRGRRVEVRDPERLLALTRA